MSENKGFESCLAVIICFIVAAIVYFVVGLIITNIVWSCIDVENCTILQLQEYRIWIYSGLTLLISFAPIAANGTESELNTFMVILGINTAIAYFTNNWEGCWPIVALIISIVYNLVNLGILTLAGYSCLGGRNK